MRVPIILLAVVTMVLLTGCGKDQLYENFYEGMNFREEMLRPTGEPGAATSPPSYQTYKRERQEDMGNSDGQ